jgi:hypothetical protein
MNANLQTVKVGDDVTSFRGERATVTGWAEPHGAQSTGRIEVRWKGRSRHANPQAYYPDVFNCEFIERTDQ